MKILIVQDHLRSGGTERQSILLANAFSAAGQATTLLTFRPGGALASTVSEAVQRIALQPFDTQLDWFAPRLLSTARRVEPDVVLCMGRMANCYAGSLQMHLGENARGTAVIATMRTGKSLPWLFRRSLRLARHVVANSHEARDALATQHAIDPAKLSVIHNSLVFPNADPAPRARAGGAEDATPSSRASATILADADCPSRESLRAQHGASATTTVLLCVAMFRPEKNQRELIEIAAGLPPELDWHLWLAGDGPMRAACDAAIRARSLESRVKLLGLVRNPSTLYAAADIAVHASKSESLSNFLIEAQAHGLPTVACAAQGISESMVPERTGWIFARGDHAGFRAAIERLARTSADERAALADAARGYARTTFDPARQVAAYLALFEQLRRADSR